MSVDRFLRACQNLAGGVAAIGLVMSVLSPFDFNAVTEIVAAYLETKQ